MSIIIPVCLVYSSRHLSRLLSIINTDTKSSRIVGGNIRDIILGKQENDIDIATQLLPDALMSLLQSANIKFYTNGIKFGTIRAVIEREAFEITTLRRDTKCYGRHADVEFVSNYYEDAQRRDFTINALSYCYYSNLLYDYFGGIQHLRDRKVVFIGDPNTRIQEDALRIMRFFRFSAHYAHKLDIDGYIACKYNAARLSSLSAERITYELDRIIDAPNSVYILHIMQEIGIFKYINLQLKLNLDILNNAKLAAKKRNYVLNTDMLYALLFSENEIDQIKNNILKLRFSKKRVNTIITICTFLNECKVGNTANIIKKWWIRYGHLIQNYINLASALYYITEDNRVSMLELINNSPPPKLPINGHDLLNLGVPPKSIKHITEYLHDAWINSNFTLKKEHMVNLVLNQNYKT